ncbi:mitochondrial basic amino acids transporter [Neocloeon triangulifer]|uniref:mitochondrial basic amino acids transporter n=1 Tax=Neocloeon triangulifer TaxID=2078957 RepID=UPI00286ED4FF|nr:mitochondrial basic amino acids transporter [Neocloeon triangulifer]
MALDFFAGCVGGCSGVLVGHPLDTIKVRLQTQDFRNPVYRGTFHCFKTIVEKESVRGLYKGMSSPLAGVAFVNAIIFGVQGNIQRRLSEPDSLKSHFFAGAAAGLSQSWVASPLELAKTKMQIQQGDRPKYRNPLHCLRDVFHREGWRGVFRGQLITVYRDVPGFSTYFLSYEAIARAMAGDDGSHTLGTAAILFAGGTAGCISWVACYPFDVIKSRLQADNKYKGMVDCFKVSYRDEGLRFLSRGLSSTMIRSFPTNAATFAAVTWVMRAAGAVEAPASDHLSASEFFEEIRRIPFGAAASAAMPLSHFMNLRLARAERDMPSVNGEEGEEVARNIVMSAGNTILGTLGRLTIREVESAIL